MNRSGEARGPEQREPSDEPIPEVEFSDSARRKLIDELIQTGVPAAAVQERGERNTLWLSIRYIFIPLVAVSLLFGLAETSGSNTNASADGRPKSSAAAQGSSKKIDISAQNLSFDTDRVTLEAGARTVLHFYNREASSIQHNVSIYKGSDAQDPIFQGKIIPGGTDIDYEFTASSRGQYFFRSTHQQESRQGPALEPQRL